MSTSYMYVTELFAQAYRAGLTMVNVFDSDPQEYRIMIEDVLVFHGDADRCSDFLKGYLAAKAIK